MGFEQLIRPFTSKDVSPFRTQTATAATGATGASEPIILRWGESGTLKTFSGSKTVSASYYVKHKPTEVEGATDVTEGPWGDGPTYPPSY